MKYIQSVLVFLILSVSISLAEPYFALRTGFKCSQCHVNKTGGGKRTSFGVSFAQGQLSSNQFVDEEQDFFNGTINDYVSVGGNYRIEEQLDFAYRYESSRLPSGRSRSLVESNLYFEFKLIPDLITFYWDVNATNGVARELFALIDYKDYFLKYGQILLPYGLRLIDDDEKNFIRRVTGYSYDRTDQGVEVGYEVDDLSVVANYTLTNGSFVAQFVESSWRIGVSGGMRFKENRLFVPDAGFGEDSELGIFTGFSKGQLVFLAEYDYVMRENKQEAVLFVETNYLVLKGVNIKGIYEAHHPDVDVSIVRNLSVRYQLGVEYFPNPFIILSGFVRIRDAVPINGRANQDDIIARLHVHM